MASERIPCRAAVLATCAGFALLACARSEPPSFDVRVVVRADGSAPVPGAQIRVRGDYMATSDAQGRATLSVTGNPGERLPVSLACPEGFRAPPVVGAIELPAQGAPAQPLTLALGCEALLHDGVIVVHATAGSGPLPVKIDGAVVGQTDELGFAHVHVRASSDSSFEVSLDTSGNSALRPANPAQRFTLRDDDELFVFDAAFDDAKTSARKQRGARRRPRAIQPPL